MTFYVPAKICGDSTYDEMKREGTSVREREEQRCNGTWDLTQLDVDQQWHLEPPGVDCKKTYRGKVLSLVATRPKQTDE